MYMNSFEFKHYGNDIVAHNKSLFSAFPISLFDPKYLVDNSLLHQKYLNVRDSNGRGAVYVFKFNQYDLVLRHYYRGGHIHKFTKDTYVWRGLHNTRAVEELDLLSLMLNKQLPVPTPIAAHIKKMGLTYTADIVTQLIPNTQSISSFLKQDALQKEYWHKIGLVIQKFHNHSINHADLNAHNILIDDKNNIFLIDFDKSKVDKSTSNWRQRNLERFQRSLLKLKNTNSTFNYSEKDYSLLLEGYNN